MTTLARTVNAYGPMGLVFFLGRKGSCFYLPTILHGCLFMWVAFWMVEYWATGYIALICPCSMQSPYVRLDASHKPLIGPTPLPLLGIMSELLLLLSRDFCFGFFCFCWFLQTFVFHKNMIQKTQILLIAWIFKSTWTFLSKLGEHFVNTRSFFKLHEYIFKLFMHFNYLMQFNKIFIVSLKKHVI